MQSVLFAILLSAGPIAVLAHGFAGTGSTITGLLMAAPIAALLLLARWREFRPDICDVLFVLFCCGIALSFAVNGVAAPKEAALLGLSLAAYPAVRVSSRCGQVPQAFVVVTGAIVAVGAVVTLVALLGQWNDHHGKPLVFDEYDAAPAQFTTALGLLLLALACTELNWRRTAWISILAAVPLAIFAASMVRYSFIVIVVALLAAMLVAKAGQRKFIAVIVCVTIASVALGAVVRSSTTLRFAKLAEAALGFQVAEPGNDESPAPPVSPPASALPAPAASGRVATEAAPPVPAPPPSQASCPSIDPDNSIIIRQQLYKDAFALLPEAGLTGLGLDGFPQRSCLKGFQVHNSILQAIIEFGWPAGIFLILLLYHAMGTRMFSLARINREARFVLCSLVFTLMLSMAHGRISRDLALFLFLGYAAKLRSSALDIEEQAWVFGDGPIRTIPAPGVGARLNAA
ncbi:O-antigen ligase family protein [Bradyrhizobium sp. Arg237L]|uniref:O-antigen ligase family protein n=1 Tax=Bradyrhizobium sp. Arg237L TaxID=3003352 RepID=UPI00249E36EE|nr:O-antigen ligase family protein [Bradyrhizobium sp. Arg237L]MDI4234445.1 O-antigen ligase family protein [Bradyrhizobium sp. Arg237L]